MDKNFRETLNEQLQTPEFKAEWDALESERQDLRASIEGYDEYFPTAEHREDQKDLFF